MLLRHSNANLSHHDNESDQREDQTKRLELYEESYRGGPCQRDRILDRISDLFLGSLFSQQRAHKLANVSHTLVSKVETIAVCEREQVAHVCCAPWPSACPCTLIVVPMRVLFPKKKENIAVHDLPKLQPQAIS